MALVSIRRNHLNIWPSYRLKKKKGTQNAGIDEHGLHVKA